MHTPDQVLARLKSVLRVVQCLPYEFPGCDQAYALFTVNLGNFDVELAGSELRLKCPDQAGVFFAQTYTPDFSPRTDGLDVIYAVQHTLDYAQDAA